MGCKNYKFEWTGTCQWRLTSRRGMCWEGELLFDKVDTSRLDQFNVVLLDAKIIKGDNSPIPINGLEKLKYHIKRSVINGTRKLVDKLVYNV